MRHIYHNAQRCFVSFKRVRASFILAIVGFRYVAQKLSELFTVWIYFDNYSHLLGWGYAAQLLLVLSWGDIYGK